MSCYNSIHTTAIIHRISRSIRNSGVIFCYPSEIVAVRLERPELQIILLFLYPVSTIPDSLALFQITYCLHHSFYIYRFILVSFRKVVKRKICLFNSCTLQTAEKCIIIKRNTFLFTAYHRVIIRIIFLKICTKKKVFF